MEDARNPGYEARLRRIEDAAALRVPDRVPVASCQMMYYMTRVRGISNAEAMIETVFDYGTPR